MKTQLRKPRRAGVCLGALSSLLLCGAAMYGEEVKKSAPDPAPAPRPANMTERELYLLNEIDALKNRLEELESRLAGSPGKPAQPVTASSAVPTETPAPATPAAPLQETQ